MTNKFFIGARMKTVLFGLGLGLFFGSANVSAACNHQSDDGECAHEESNSKEEKKKSEAGH